MIRGTILTTRSFFEAVALCTFVLHVCASFWSSFLFLKPNFFLLLHDGEFDLIRRAHLLCILKRHHTYGVNTFVCSYSLNSNPSHFLVLSSLLDWQPYLLCGFPGFVTLLERRVRAPRKRFEPRTIFYQTLTQMRPRVPCYFLGPIEDKANSSRFGSSLPSHFLLFFLFYFFFFFFFFFFFSYNPSVMRMRLRHQRQR